MIGKSLLIVLLFGLIAIFSPFLALATSNSGTSTSDNSATKLAETKTTGNKVNTTILSKTSPAMKFSALTKIKPIEPNDKIKVAKTASIVKKRLATRSLSLRQNKNQAGDTDDLMTAAGHEKKKYILVKKKPKHKKIKSEVFEPKMKYKKIKMKIPVKKLKKKKVKGYLVPKKHHHHEH